MQLADPRGSRPKYSASPRRVIAQGKYEYLIHEKNEGERKAKHMRCAKEEEMKGAEEIS